MQVVPFPARPSAEAPVVESERTRAFVLPAGAALPEGADLVFDLSDGSRFAYVPRAPGGPVQERAIDPFARGNKFAPLHESERALSALLSIAAGRRVDTGPESERLFVFLRGPGLLFEENGDTHRFAPHQCALVPAGEPARVWAQGPEDALVVVCQPKGEAVARRTLAGEIAKRREPTT